jgi:putative zinc finger/helix-turn-helix YgiT family protein
MKCAQCGHRMEKTTGVHRYEESGLKNVMLMNVPLYKCTSCGETEVEIPAMEELHCLIGLFVLYQPDRLGSAEVRYLRKHMGYSQDELASYVGVTRGTITRWESGGTIRIDQDKALRQLYVRKKHEELEHIGIDSKRLLEVVLERLLTAQEAAIQNPNRRLDEQRRRKYLLSCLDHSSPFGSRA